MEEKSMTPQSFVRTTTIVYSAFLTSQLLFALVAFLQHQRPDFRFQDGSDLYIFIVPILAIVCFVASTIIFKKQVQIVAEKPTLKEKLTVYTSAFLVRVALLEAPSLFGIVTFFLTGNLALLLVSAILFCYMITLWPAKDRIEKDLSLTFQEKMIWDDPNVEIN